MTINTFESDSTDKDAFGSLRVSEKVTIQDSQNVVDFDTRFFYNAVIYDSASPVILAEDSNASGIGSNGSFIGPLDPNSRMIPMELDSTYAAGQVVVQMKEYAADTPGKSQLFFQTGIFSPNVNRPNEQVRMVLRSSCSGSTQDTKFEQSGWNKDKLDGSGASKISLDSTKIQIYWVDVQMLYSGRIRFGFDIDGELITAHEEYLSNVNNLPALQNYNLPLRQEIENVSGRAASRAGIFDHKNGIFLEIEDDFNTGKAKVWIKCHTVQSEGGADLGGMPVTEYKLASTTITTTVTPILSIRPLATFNGFPNNSLIFPINFGAINTGNLDCVVVLIQNADLTGGAWVDPIDTQASNSHTYEVNLTATAITGGHFITSFPLHSTTGSKSQSLSSGIKHIRVPLLYSRIDDLEIRQETLTVSAVTASSSTTVGITTLDIEEIKQ